MYKWFKLAAIGSLLFKRLFYLVMRGGGGMVRREREGVRRRRPLPCPTQSPCHAPVPAPIPAPAPAPPTLPASHVHILCVLPTVPPKPLQPTST